jgi:hypothetical protein
VWGAQLYDRLFFDHWGPSVIVDPNTPALPPVKQTPLINIGG